MAITSDQRNQETLLEKIALYFLSHLLSIAIDANALLCAKIHQQMFVVNACSSLHVGNFMGS